MNNLTATYQRMIEDWKDGRLDDAARSARVLLESIASGQDVKGVSTPRVRGMSNRVLRDRRDAYADQPIID